MDQGEQEEDNDPADEGSESDEYIKHGLTRWSGAVVVIVVVAVLLVFVVFEILVFLVCLVHVRFFVVVRWRGEADAGTAADVLRSGRRRGSGRGVSTADYRLIVTIV
jgi:hypothetical protein